jgi:hypothetical protein
VGGALLCFCASATSADGSRFPLGFGDHGRDRAPLRWYRRRFEADRLSQDSLERLEMAIGCPDLELGVSGRIDLQQRIDTAVAKVEAGDVLRVTPVEAFGDAQDGRECANGLTQR